ncbi:MAG: type II toxin-antitoxin system VapC family toxin [Gammaproteobacteria bacterium]|nr:type II toxin-antitoxin system VapC family toxin [Gammaproteobacteria bacterium]
MQRSLFVLDCSVTMTWLFKDEVTPYTTSVLNSLIQTTALVPVMWSLEVNNVLLMTEKRSRVSHMQAVAFKQALREMPIREDNIENNDAYEIAREFNLTAYDGSYLELALRKKIPIATLDKALRHAAKNSGVDLYLTNE